jgi:hypothetical protein
MRSAPAGRASVRAQLRSAFLAGMTDMPEACPVARVWGIACGE